MLVLDTSFLVDLLRGREEASEKLCQLEEEYDLVCTTSMNVLELYKGAHLSAKKHQNLENLRKILDQILVLSITEETYEIFGAISAWLKSEGGPIGDFDLVIASIALVYGAAIVTNDQHLKRVPHIKIISY